MFRHQGRDEMIPPFLAAVIRSVFSLRRSHESFGVAVVSTTIRISVLFLLFWAWTRPLTSENPRPSLPAMNIRLEGRPPSTPTALVGKSVDFALLRHHHNSVQKFVNSCALLVPFEEAWEHLDWPLFEREHKATGFMSWGFVRAMIETVSPYLLAERAPLNDVSLPARRVQCDDPKFSSVLSGKKRDKPARVIDVSVFGFALDILEIRMFELNEAVDLFVVLESTVRLYSYFWSSF